VLLSQYSDETTGWTTEVRFPAGTRICSRHRVQTGPEVHPDFYPIVTGSLHLGVKRPEREDSLPSSAEVNNAWSPTSTTPRHLHSVVFNKTIHTSKWRGI